MKFRILILGTAVVLAACAKQPATVPAVAAVNQTSACTESVAAGGFAYSPFPAGFSIDIPVHFRQDKIMVNPADGSYRRQVAFEYLVGDVKSTFESVSAALVSAGYSAQKTRTKTDGRLSAKFAKGSESVVLNVVPNAGAKPSNPMAKGVFALNMPYAGVTPDTASPAP